MSAFFQYLHFARLGVEGRFFRVFWHITASKNQVRDQGEGFWKQLSLLKSLEGDAIEMNAPAFVGHPSRYCLDLY